ncbi:MAG: TIGR04283 family arsenosugar biosynthesis glycosyltransferase [Rubricoccaceae bacterium]
MVANTDSPARVSVVIPTLNEAGHIADTLRSIEDASGQLDVIVADGDSTDGTLDRVREIAPSGQIVYAPRGRARQMNAGAELATGSVLLFLHADTRLPHRAIRDIREALSDASVAGGCFRTTFDDTQSVWMRLWQARMWMRWHRFAFGDRGLFVRRSVFDAIGGFPDQPIFEDLDMVRAIRQHGHFCFLDAAVVTSARRYQRNGAFRQQLRNVTLWLGWTLGISPARLKRFYPDATTQRS